MQWVNNHLEEEEGEEEFAEVVVMKCKHTGERITGREGVAVNIARSATWKERWMAQFHFYISIIDEWKEIRERKEKELGNYERNNVFAVEGV